MYSRKWWKSYTSPKSTTNGSLSKQIFELFFQKSVELSCEEEYVSFGVIIGPIGTGKTVHHPKGVLYYNTCEPEDFSRELAEAVGMKVGPSNILDLILGYFSSDVFVYYHLPDNQNKAVNVIFKSLSYILLLYACDLHVIVHVFIIINGYLRIPLIYDIW